MQERRSATHRSTTLLVSRLVLRKSGSKPAPRDRPLCLHCRQRSIRYATYSTASQLKCNTADLQGRRKCWVHRATRYRSPIEKKHSRRCSHAYGDNHARRLNIGTAEAARECARWATRDDGPLRTARLRSRCPKSLGKPGRRDSNHRRHGSVPPPPASSDCPLGASPHTFFIHARDLSEAKHKRHILGEPSKKHTAGFKVSSPARGHRTVSPPFVVYVQRKALCQDYRTPGKSCFSESGPRRHGVQCGTGREWRRVQVVAY